MVKLQYKLYHSCKQILIIIFIYYYKLVLITRTARYTVIYYEF